MLIECPFCKTTAKISDEQEDSKVRCASCKKVYVARDATAGSAASQQVPLRIALVSLGVIAVGTIAWIVGHSSGEPPPAPKPEPVKEAPKVDSTGWNSAPVQIVREFFDAAGARDTDRLRGTLAGARVAEVRKPTEAAELAKWIAFDARSPSERDNFLTSVAKEVVADTSADGVVIWKPSDGNVSKDLGSSAMVRVKVSPRDPKTGGLETRNFDFEVVRDGERWKVASWSRVKTDEEVRNAQRVKKAETKKVELADGTSLSTAKPRHVDHFADTTPELRARIDKLFATMTDLSLTTEVERAQHQLVAIGRPALPVLLSGLNDIRIVDEDTATKVNLINTVLQDMTGQNMGFAPQDTAERRQLAVDAWFGWWVRYGDTFQAAPPPDEGSKLPPGKAPSGGH